MRRSKALIITATFFVVSYDIDRRVVSAADSLITPTIARSVENSSSAATDLTIEEKFKHHVCRDTKACRINDISNRSLNYGEWFASKLGLGQLDKTPSASGIFIEAGPNKEGEWISLGIVRYRSDDRVRISKMASEIRQAPSNIFTDGKAAFQFRVLTGAESIDVVFTDRFGPHIDCLLESLVRK